MQIIFYNNFHNGDIFYSREFIKDIMIKTGEQHQYNHNNSFSILKDISIEQVKGNSLPNFNLYHKSQNKIFINTWIGQGNRKYMSHECSLKSNYNLYSDIYNILGIKIESIEYYIPSVNFNFIKNNYSLDNSILICNNNTLSGQANNFDFDPIIDYLSKIFYDKKFIITNETRIIKENVFNIKDIIGFEENNLLEISHLSTKTDIIIGRGSGPFCFTHIKDNINNKNKKFISFTYNEHNGKWVNDEFSKAKQYWNKNVDLSEIEKIIRF